MVGVAGPDGCLLQADRDPVAVPLVGAQSKQVAVVSAVPDLASSDGLQGMGQPGGGILIGTAEGGAEVDQTLT